MLSPADRGKRQGADRRRRHAAAGSCGSADAGNLRRLEALVEDAPVDDLGFLDKAVLLDCLQRAALGNAGDAGALLPLNDTPSLLLWLTQQRRTAHSGTEPLPPGPSAGATATTRHRRQRDDPSQGVRARSI